MNGWKYATYALAAVLVVLVIKEVYWHRRWQDTELYYLKANQAQIIQWIQTHQGAK